MSLQSNFRGGAFVPSDVPYNPEVDDDSSDDDMVSAEEDEGLADEDEEEDQDELEVFEDSADDSSSIDDDEKQSEDHNNPHAERIQKDQAELRRKIVEIQKDLTIPPAEKAKKIQELMTNSWSSKLKGVHHKAILATNKLEDKKVDYAQLADIDLQKTYHDKLAGILGCKHYQRAAKLQAHCCGKWYTCRFCHDEVSDHNIVRNMTTTMMCMHCSTVQPAGQDCANPQCKKRVARYFCRECKLWDDDPRKNIYHCFDCGICRIGKGLGIDYFHCNRCNVCMAISLRGRHKCIERNLESDCPICGEFMFTSTTTVIFMPCGHCIHYKCHQDYIQTSYQCPTCFKSLANMSEYFKRIDNMLQAHKMPPEYKNTFSYIYCNDCEKKCHARYHFLYHKCSHCSGYNTKVLHTVETKDGEDLTATEEEYPGGTRLEAVELQEEGEGGPSSGHGRTSIPAGNERITTEQPGSESGDSMQIQSPSRSSAQTSDFQPQLSHTQFGTGTSSRGSSTVGSVPFATLSPSSSLVPPAFDIVDHAFASPVPIQPPEQYSYDNDAPSPPVQPLD
ncbi:hypothetical protein HDU76_013328 [Blyttiomyces sp. JEL0837]|nr:hypothetical protein HDU76_013328 [Blyttiomyces sp. JEL0837]